MVARRLGFLAGCAVVLVLGGCGASEPAVLVSNAASGAAVLSPSASLQQSLNTLNTCVSGAQGLDRAAASVCYDGFAFTLDGVSWPTRATADVASLRTAATDTAGCLKTANACDADVARLHMFADRVSAEVG